MQRTSLYFIAPRHVKVRQEPLPDPAPNQVIVQTLCTGISPGTEMLAYRGQFPPEMALDETIEALSGGFRYPLQYGYAAAGQVIHTGSQVEAGWQGRLVFAFQPHTSHFIARPDELMPIPEGIEPEEAIFLPNMETAVNFIMDGRPMVGERVIVFGQGIVGLLTTAILSQFPLETLVTLDRYPLRRQASLELGAHASLDPQAPETSEELRSRLSSGADLAYELSGVPQVLNDAITWTGYKGRVIIGSWYGQKQTNLNLGGRFHRSRIQLISSQVSTLAPEHSGRWTKERRFAIAWQMLRQVKPARFITQNFCISQAAEAYRLIDHTPDKTLQLVFSYP